MHKTKGNIFLYALEKNMHDRGILVKEFPENASFKWDDMLSRYSDYNLYQSFGWGEFKKSQGWRTLRLVCQGQNEDIALAQCMYKKFFWNYIIWIPGGPVFMREQSTVNLGNLQYILGDIFCRFEHKGYYLRVYPMQDYDSGIALALRGMGFQRPIQNINHGFTYHVDTSIAEAQTNERLSVNWRHNLKRSFGEGLFFRSSDSSEDLENFYKIYLQTASDNSIKPHYSLQDLIKIKDILPPFCRLNLFLCERQKKILSGRIICTIGKKAYDIAAAMTLEGRKSYATYFLLWEIINWCRGQGIEYLDMSGIDPFSNKSVFNFKKGIGGNLVEYAGEWELSTSFFLRLMVNLYISRCMKYRK